MSATRVGRIIENYNSMYMTFCVLLWRGFGLFVYLALAAPIAAPPLAEHVVIISIDGGKPAVIAQSHMPVLQKLVAEGAVTWKARTIFPSITLPSHTSMLTGVGPEKHKIGWNTWEPELGVVRVPTIFLAAKQARLTTAMFVGKIKFLHLVQPGAVDEFDFSAARSVDVTKLDANERNQINESTVLATYVAADAAHYLIEKKPNLCFIHFTDTDNAGHEYGWGSAEQIKAFGDVDDALGTVMQALTEAGIARQTVVIVTADHGGHKETHGLNIPDDMEIPWIAWGQGVKRHFTITAPVNTCDTAATALWLLNVPSPVMDGKPVTSAFEQTQVVAGASAHR